jgi:PAS domain-containing protein
MSILEALSDLLIAGAGMLLMHVRHMRSGKNVSLQQVTNDVYARNKDLEERVFKLREALMAKEKSALLVGLTLDQFPFPFWVKDSSLRMLSINQKYVDMFGISKNDYEGKRDHDVWSKTIADSFQKGDKFVINNNKPWAGVESVEDGEGNTRMVFSWKWPVFVGNDVVAVAGACEEIELINKIFKDYEIN